ncbi:hypothetical protein PTKIN_Ptkin02bG0171300 [Pterospermum kingtungense]
MGRATIAKTTILMLREAKRVERHLSKIAAAGADRSSNDIKDSSSWVPHPKSGIYYPKGHEWVMGDVPDGAASFGRTLWLRNVDDGVEKPEPDHELPNRDQYFHADM